MLDVGSDTYIDHHGCTCMRLLDGHCDDPIKLCSGLNRAVAPKPLSGRKRSEIDIRACNVLPDPAVIGRSVAAHRYLMLMDLVVEE